jgi:hypothetical protein
MTEATHTDGPWQLESNDEGEYIVGSDGETIALLSNDVMVDGQREADARLIAAAPDLLFAAQAIYKIVERIVMDAEDHGMALDAKTNAIIDCLDAAITKATATPGREGQR